MTRVPSRESSDGDATDDRQDFGILLGLAFNAFATELRAAVAAAGFADVPSSFGYVAPM